MGNWLQNPKVRAWLTQTVILVVVGALVCEMVSNTIDNLNSRDIASGFDFLSSTAGFDINMHLLPYSEQSSYGQAFLVALLNTLLVSSLGIVFATFLGFAVGVGRLSQNFLVSKLCGFYVEVLRNIPLLLQLFFWYFAVLRSMPSPRQAYSFSDMIFLNIRGLYLPSFEFAEGFIWTMLAILLAIAVTIGIGLWAVARRKRTGTRFPVGKVGLALLLFLPTLTFLATGSPVTMEKPALEGFNFQGGLVLIPEFVALLVALSSYTAAFIAEIVRAGILAVSKGQIEAAQSLGLTRSQTLRLVVVPQAMRVIIPPLTSQYLNLTKNSSLAAAIAYPDLVLVFAGTVLMQTGQAVEVILLTMAVYLTISLSIALGMNVFNKRMALVER